MPLIRKSSPSAEVSSPDASSVFAALERGTDEERWTAARIAPELQGGVQALGQALSSERNPRVREVIFTGLAKIDSPEAVEFVLPFLRSDDSGLRTAALDALRTMKCATRSYLQRLLNDADADVRVLACELARNVEALDAADLLCGLLDREMDANVCASAIEVLAEVGGIDALPSLERCAERFRGMAFLDFSIQITADRIRSQSSHQRG